MEPQQTVDITCPYCGEEVRIVIDCTAGSQQYVEDCQVCCRPITIRVRIGAVGYPAVDALREDD